MARLDFKGKQLVWNHHLAVPYHELIPDTAKSLTDKVSLHDNLIIHGDNLLALKALLPTYAGKVKCIYIDPPYNTGNEGWAYNDNVNSPMIRDWLGKTVDRDDLTRHDKWLCMMTPRLKMLRELLRDDGVIFISIDDNEVHRLRLLMDEVFGEENFVGQFMWTTKNAARGVPPKTMLMPNHEYVVCYGRDAERVRFSGITRDENDFSNPDSDPRGPWRSESMKATGNGGNEFDIRDPKSGREFHGKWAFSQEKVTRMIEDNLVLFPATEDGVPRQKKFFDSYLNENKAFVTNLGWFSSENATKDLMTIFDSQKMFDFPKPVELVKFFVAQATSLEDIVLDSFAGSGTTAHAVLAQNAEDGGNRKFILVEVEDDVADKITAERVRRVMQGVPGAKDDKLKQGFGGSFSYFELGKPIEMQSILSGERLPSYVDLARYVFYTATGEEFNESKVDEVRHFIGESSEYEVYLIYEPDVAKLKNLALTLNHADAWGKPAAGAKPRLVFAPTKYLNQQLLDEYRISFAQLPFEIYELSR